MEMSPTSNIKIGLDEEGFMQEPEKWNKDIAKILAERQGIVELSEVHWKVINSLRDYYLKGLLP